MDSLINTILFQGKSKDLCQIIYSYIDYSLENLHKNIPIKIPKLNLYLNCSIMDVITKCVRLGRCGFYIPKLYEDFFNQIESDIRKIDILLIARSINQSYCVELKNFETPLKTTVCIFNLNVMEYEWE